MAERIGDFGYRWFAAHKGIDVYIATAPKIIDGVFYMALGLRLVHSVSFDELKAEIDAWWKLRRN